MKKLPEAKLLRGLLVLAALSLLLPGFARAQEDPPTRVARLSYVSGDVSFQPGGEDEWGWGGINRPLTTGDALWIEAGSRAELAIGANVMRLGEETDFSFLNLDDDIVQIQLNSGTLSFTVRRLYRGEAIEIDTPNVAVLLVEPGTYRIDADPYGDFTSVTVREGRSEIFGGRESFALDAGSMLEAEGSDRVRFAVYDMPPDDELDRFAESRERRFERSEAARYVSWDVTGYEELDGRGSWRSDPSYGRVWMPRVSVGWAPFRDGTWTWIDPWGWTWIDEAEWGFATSHYGRWVRIGNRNGFVWAWVPPRPSRGPHGPSTYPVPTGDRCVYSPANVTFLGSPSESRVAWFPLAPGEVYVPAFHASITYINQLNITNTVVEINFVQTVINTAPDRVRYVNRIPEAVVAVPRTVFVGAQPVARARVQVSVEVAARTPVVRAAPVAPARASVFAEVKVRPAASAPKPPVAVRTRTVVAKATPPPKRVTFAQKERALAADPGKPVDRKTERTIAAAAPAPAPPPVVKAEAPAAPPKTAAKVPKAERREDRKALRKVDRTQQSAAVPKPAPQATPPPPESAPQPDASRSAAEKTRQEQQAARKAEADKQRAEQEAAAGQQTAKTRQEQEAARKAEADKQRAAQEAAAGQQAAKTRQEQQAARKAEADKQRAEQETAARQQAEKTRQEQQVASQAEADKARRDQNAARKAEADRQRLEQEAAAGEQAAKTRQEQQAARKAEADKQRAEQEVAGQQAAKTPQEQQAAQKAARPPSAAGAPVRVNESVQAAKLVSQPKVEAPKEAAGVEGTVVVRARIGADGRVRSAQVLRGPKQLERAALQNARGRVYEPTLVDGRPVEVETEISVVF